VKEIYEKTGRTGTMVFVVIRSTLKNQKDEVLAHNRPSLHETALDNFDQINIGGHARAARVVRQQGSMPRVRQTEWGMGEGAAASPTTKRRRKKACPG